MDCKTFHENLRAFIDNELPVNLYSAFIRHDSDCSACHRDLVSLQKIKNSLAGLRRLSLSPEFDFRMKSSIRREYELLRNPFYIFRLFFFDNLTKFIMVPAFALVLIIGAVLYLSYHDRSGLPPGVVSYLESRESVVLGPDDERIDVDEVRYVLKSVKPFEFVRDERDSDSVRQDSDSSQPVDNSLTLISF